MPLRLLHALRSLRTSYWFLPTVMAGTAVALALALAAVDRRVSTDWVDGIGWLYSGGPDGARAVLSTLAGAVLSTAGVVFSITIAALSLASQQMGPRLLRNFMRDTGNQVVLGTFISTFVYCLLVLRTVRGEAEGQAFVPQIAVTVGVVLGLASLGVLIFFIHHVATSIQAPIVVAAVGQELAEHVDRVFRPGEPRDDEEARTPGDFGEDAVVVASPGDGYVQAIDEGGLIEVADRHGLWIRIDRRPGHFVQRGAAIARIDGGDGVDEEICREVARRFVLGAQRTDEQDVEFAVDQLAEVAVRALSPGINDPFTALACLDWMGAGLGRAAAGTAPRPERRGEGGRVRISYESPIDFAGLVDAAFNPVRQYGRTSPMVLVRMLETIEAILHRVRGDAGATAVLLRHAGMVHRAGRDAFHEPLDVDDLEARYAAVLEAAAGQPVPARRSPPPADSRAAD